MLAALISLICAYAMLWGLWLASTTLGLVAMPDEWERRTNIAYWCTILLIGSFDIILAATPGKAILRIAVGRFDCTPAPVSARVLRFAVMYGPFVLYIANDLSPHPAVAWFGSFWLGGVLLGCLASANDGKQAWHDQLAGTAIFRRREIYIRDARPGSGFEPTPPPLPPS